MFKRMGLSIAILNILFLLDLGIAVLEGIRINETSNQEILVIIRHEC